MFLQRLLLLIALFATLVVLGCWDNTHQIERVLEQGYAATAHITGAQYQRRMPLAVDGWRPRLVEQELSVDLKWDDKDGKEHEHKQVPVTEGFARTVVSGDQVRLATVGIEALDDAVPVIVLDASARLASLGNWSTSTGYAALAAWVAFVGLTLWRRRIPQGARDRGLPSLAELPPKRSIAGVGLVLIGSVLALQAWSAIEANASARSGGTKVTAEILGVSNASGGGHAVMLAWKDAQGAVRHFGPVRISEAFFRQIARDGELVVHQTELRTHDDDPRNPPTIVADIPEPGWFGRIGLAAGMLLAVFGLGLLFSALRSVGRR